MATTITSETISRSKLSETNFGGTVCGKSARTGLWGCGKVTTRTTRKGKDKPEDVTASAIKEAGVIFTLGTRIKETLTIVKYEKV